jgi:hypothetical protein
LQTATCYVYLGGDKGTSVPLGSVTVAEIAVLRLIHGTDAVHDIEPTGEIERTHREERQRLVDTYGRAMIDDEAGQRVSAVQALFPGAAARVFTSFDEIDVPDECFKAEKRMTAKKGKKPAKAALADPVDDPELFG